MSLPQLDASVLKRVLVVVAHPDDPEYGLAAAVNSWISEGVEVAYLLLTHGEAGIRDLNPAECATVRATEQRHACEEVGVTELEILNHPDGHLVYGLDIRRDIARKIREFMPDTVVTLTFGVEASWGLNQADHRVAGLATVDAVRDADNPWVFSELDLPAWSVDRLLVVGESNPTHQYVVDKHDEQAAIESLASHQQYLAALPDHPAPEEFLPQLLHSESGDTPAVNFRVYEM